MDTIPAALQFGHGMDAVEVITPKRTRRCTSCLRSSLPSFNSATAQSPWKQVQFPLGWPLIRSIKVQPELTVFSVLAPVVEEEPVAAEVEGAAAAGSEVIKEKKEEGETAAAHASGSAAKEKAAPKEREQKK